MNAAESYETLDGDRVTLKLREVLDVQEVLSDQLLDGTDLFSTFLGRKDAQALLRMMKEPVGTS